MGADFVAVEELRCARLDRIQDLQGVLGELSKILARNITEVKVVSGGGCNEGLAVLKSAGGADLFAKIVKSQRGDGVPAEADNFLAMASKHSTIASDPGLSWPIKIIRLCLADGSKKDLIVMPKVAGEDLDNVISLKWSRGQIPQCLDMLEKFGSFLRRFHEKYGQAQHTDLSTSNIFYDESRDTFCLIDLGHLGQHVSESDVQQFIRALTTLSKFYGPQLQQEGVMRFNQGYNQVQSKVPTQVQSQMQPQVQSQTATKDSNQEQSQNSTGVGDDDSEFDSDCSDSEENGAFGCGLFGC